MRWFNGGSNGGRKASSEPQLLKVERLDSVRCNNADLVRQEFVDEGDDVILEEDEDVVDDADSLSDVNLEMFDQDGAGEKG